MDGGKLAFLALGLACTACPAPNTYTTPRTLAPGDVQHTVSADTTGFGGTSVASRYRLTVPSYALRVGLAERFELGVRVPQLSSLGLDLKWNALRSEVFDLALDPGGQIFALAGGGDALVVYYVHLPLLLGFNLSREVTLLLTPGVTLLGAGTSFGDHENRYGGTGSVWLGRIGFGVDLRLTPKFSLQPEATMLRSFESGDGFIYQIGIGFKFGAQPTY